MQKNMQELLTDSITGLKALAELLEAMKEERQVADENLQPELFPKVEQKPIAKEEKPSLSLVDVRKVLAEKSRDGHTEQVRNLLIKYGADKLSEIDPQNYPSLLQDAECLGATLDDIQGVLKSLEGSGQEDQVTAILDHHYATSLNDLKVEYYAGFLRDIRELGRE